MGSGNDAVKISSCKFLFDLYNAEHILFSEAKASHLCTADSRPTAQLFISITTITIIALNKVDAGLTMPGNQYSSNHINQDLAYSTGEFQLSNPPTSHIVHSNDCIFNIMSALVKLYLTKQKFIIVAIKGIW